MRHRSLNDRQVGHCQCACRGFVAGSLLVRNEFPAGGLQALSFYLARQFAPKSVQVAIHEFD
jgi:hypothetical protein